MRSWIHKQLKKKSRIYIMPTRMGGYLNGLIFLMFLLSVGYSNNLLLIFTLFLFGLNLIWVIQTHFHLHKLKIASVMIQDGHALDPLAVKIIWKLAPPGPYKWEMKLEGEKVAVPVHSIKDSITETDGQVTLPVRGIWLFLHLRVKTEMPFGLYQSWVYLPVNVKTHAYPVQLKHMPRMNEAQFEREGEFSNLRSGPHDVWNLSPYQGEESRKISWKHYAKSGELVVKEGEELSSALIRFKLPTDTANKEFLLSTLATQMVHCARSDTTFSLETPHKKLAAASGQYHLHECLRELSLC